MKVKIIDDLLLRAIPPHVLKAYFSSQQWEPVEDYGDHSKVYIYKPNGRTEAILPATDKLGDYHRVVSSLIEILSNIEGRDELQVYRDLSTAGHDVIRIRTPDAEDDGSIQIDSGFELIRNSKELLLSAACSASQPKNIYRAGSIVEANDYLKKVRLGQTEQGSFIINLLAPVPVSFEPKQIEMLDLPPIDEPYERRVTRMLASGLDSSAQAIEKYNKSGNVDAFKNSFLNGVSANLCDATANLIDLGHDIEFSITWAKTRPSPQKRWQRTFSSSEGKILRAAGKDIRAKQPREIEIIEGYIPKLTRENLTSTGEVVIKTIIDGKLTSVKISASGETYNKFVTAHREGKSVAVHGKVEQVGQRWKMSEPTSIDFIEDEN